MKDLIERFRSSFSKEKEFFIAVLPIVWQGLFVGVPLAIIVISSFYPQWGKFHFASLTLHQFKTVVTGEHFHVIGNSLIVAFLTTVICLVVGYPVAYFLTIRMQRFRMLMFMLLALPFWTNFLVLAYSCLFFLGKAGALNRILMSLHIITTPLSLLNKPIAVIVVMIYCYLPFMILPIYVSLERLNKRLIEASLDLGATGWKTFIQVTLPLTMSGVGVGCFLVFVPSFGEYAIPALFGGDKTLYVGSLITEYFLSFQTINTGAAFTVVTSLILLIVLAVMRFFMRDRDDERVPL